MIRTSVVLLVILSQSQAWSSTIPTPTPSSSFDSSPTPTPTGPTSNPLANYLLSLIDPQKNPCESLYDFACAKYETSCSDYVQNTNTIIENIVTAPIKDDDTKAQKLFKTYYASCADTKTLNGKKYEPVKKILDNFDWPWINSDWDESSFTWSEATVKLREIGDSADEFLTIDTPDFQIKSATLRLGESDEDVKKFEKKLVDVLKMYGIEASKVDSDIADVIKFMVKLAKISDTSAMKEASEQYNQITIGELDKKSETDINWLEFINKMIKTANADESTTIIVTLVSFVDAFSQLISETPKRVQANFLLSNLVYFYMGLTTDEARKIIKDGEQDDRNSKCALTYVQPSLTVAVDSVFVKELMDKDSIPMVTEICESIQTELAELVRQAKWLDDAVKQKAAEKVQAIILFVGYSKDLLDENKVNAYYESLYEQLSATEFIENYLKIHQFHFNELDSLYRQTNDRTVIQLSDLSYFNPSSNTIWYIQEKVAIAVPSSVILHPYFGVDQPTSMNYGGLGYYIGSSVAISFRDTLYDQLSATEFIENCLKISKFHFNEVDSLYGQTNDRTVMPLSDYSLYSTTGSSVYYLTKKVAVVVPSSMLLHPRFGVDYPTSMNYGGIGYYIASVMAYTFKGNDKFDASGSINPIWTDEAKAKYEEKTKCLQDQYSCIVVDKNINLDGAKTNILDVRELVGVKILYLAFQKVANKNEASLPGLSYTTNQLFWIAYAKEKCETKNNDGTTPAIYLVDQTVANLEQFSNDFGCKEGDKLYLKDRCTIV